MSGPPGTRQISSEWQKLGHLHDGAGATGKVPDRAARTDATTASSAVSSLSSALSSGTGVRSLAAIEYSSSTSVIVDLAYTDGNVYVAVSDTAVNSLPVLRRPGQGTHAGRGLRIVGSSATWWGVTAAAQTKTVWAELGRVRPPTSDAI